MNFSSLQLSKIFLFITVSLLLILTILTYQRVQNLIIYSDLVDHTNDIRIELEKTLSYLKDAETGQRGFIMTRDSIFFEPYIGSYEKIRKSLDKLDSLTADHAVQKENVRELRRLNDERYEVMNMVLEEAQQREKGYNRSKQAALLLKDKMRMDELRSHVRKMIEVELKLLKKREGNKNRYASLTPMFIVLLMVFSLGLIIISYFIIIGELKKTRVIRNELEHKIEALNRSNSELEQFAYIASHDLQEPLRKIQSFGDRLAGKYQEVIDADGNYIISRMQNAASRMQLLINDLLAYSRLVQQEETNLDKTDLSSTLQNIRGDFQMLIDEKKAIIKTDHLPVIRAIPSQMQQLFQNLINNALKFSKKEGIPVIVIKHEIIKGSEIAGVKPSQLNSRFHKISVIDNGIGFENQYQEKIFVIFQRLHGKLEYGGSGIGLAVCKKIVTSHNGYITADSKVNEGSVFHVYLPA